MKVSMRFEGGQELAQALAALPARVGKNERLDALRAGGELIRSHAASTAKRGQIPPHIADHIGMSTAKGLDANESAIKVGPTKGEFAYGLPLELGTVDTAAQPFMRPAFDSQAQNALGRIKAWFWASLIGSSRNAPQGSSESFEGPTVPPVSGGPRGGLL